MAEKVEWECGWDAMVGCYLCCAETRITRITSALCYVWSRKIYVKLKPVHFSYISLTLVKLRPVLYHPKLQSYNMIHLDFEE